MTDEMKAPAGVRVLQRVVFPTQGNLDVVPLYVETQMHRGLQATEDEKSGGKGRGAKSETDGSQDSPVTTAVPGEGQSAIRFGVKAQAKSAGDLSARRSAVVAAGRRVSFGAYFNAFPASYWRRWTVLDEVLLRIRIKGEATVIVYRSTAKGHSHPVESVYVESDKPQDIQLKLPLKQFIDGGWYWFDIAAGSRDATLLEADWAAHTERTTSGRLTIGITTFNRPEFCVDQLRTLGDTDEVLDILDEVLIIDQGTDTVEAHPDFLDATKGVSDRLRVIYQGNLGGSGGFSRVMDETVQGGRSDYALLLDDDVITEPEGILRAVTFADLARRPTIVGGHMFSLYDRSVLHSYGETVARYNWFWGPAPHTEHGHDFGRKSLRYTRWLHRRIDVDFNGWWMCLIPAQTIREVGLAMPVFIKWDDAEFGLRAGQAGFPTVTMPGVAVWHMPWHEKDDTIDWQAYYHLRNRAVTALLHSPYDRGGRLIRDNFQNQVRHLLSMQYSPAELRLMAIQDLLSGPNHLHRDILSKNRTLRETRKNFPDAQAESDLDNFPKVRRRKPPRKGKSPTAPGNRLSVLTKAALGAARQVVPVRKLARHHPQASVPHQDAKWWLLANVDGALVSAADGASAAWYQRDPERFRSLLGRSIALHAQLMREWPRLCKQYRSALPEFTSQERWRETFERAQPAEPERAAD